MAITGRDTDRLAAFATSTGAGERLLTTSGDASDENHLAAFVGLAAGIWGRLDTVIANAGFSPSGTLEDHGPQAMRAMVLTNILGPALLTRETLPHLEVQGPHRDRRFGRRHQEHARQPLLRHQMGRARPGRECQAPGRQGPCQCHSRRSGGCGHPILGRARWIPAAAPTLTAEQVAETILFAINQPERASDPILGSNVTHYQRRFAAIVGYGTANRPSDGPGKAPEHPRAPHSTPWVVCGCFGNAARVAETILFAINQPERVNVSHLVLRPTGQVN
ncbi:MAG TPA: SDR family NAD(P)-dependent oxidoreductase [Actinocrinis sp.]|nr:SDR family NAD(P)-dependent oxidoreductase [Actinocrinis sp.]HXR71327.1 SDR family NAD(P)-dependent oxidoreductase [Actinocrinis sp.]